MALNDDNLFRIDRIGRGGSVAIYVKTCFSVSILNAITVPKCFEFTTLKLDLGSNNHIIVVWIYRPPSADTSSIDKLADLLSQFVHSEMIILILILIG